MTFLYHCQRVALILLLMIRVFFDLDKGPHEIEDVLNKELSKLCECFVDSRLTVHFGEDNFFLLSGVRKSSFSRLFVNRSKKSLWNAEKAHFFHNYFRFAKEASQGVS